MPTFTYSPKFTYSATQAFEKTINGIATKIDNLIQKAIQGGRLHIIIDDFILGAITAAMQAEIFDELRAMGYIVDYYPENRIKISWKKQKEE